MNHKIYKEKYVFFYSPIPLATPTTTNTNRQEIPYTCIYKMKKMNSFKNNRGRRTFKARTNCK